MLNLDCFVHCVEISLLRVEFSLSVQNFLFVCRIVKLCVEISYSGAKLCVNRVELLILGCETVFWGSIFLIHGPDGPFYSCGGPFVSGGVLGYTVLGALLVGPQTPKGIAFGYFWVRVSKASTFSASLQGKLPCTRFTGRLVYHCLGSREMVRVSLHGCT